MSQPAGILDSSKRGDRGFSRLIGASFSKPARTAPLTPARRWNSSVATYWYPIYAFVRRKGLNP
jgi:hypothetical protein